MNSKAHSTHSPLAVEILHTKREILAFVGLCLALFMGNMLLEYNAYRAYITPQGTQEIYAQVIAQYTKHKNNSHYQVLKLKSDRGEIFYTTSKEDIKDLTHRFIRIYGKRLECGFVEYLKSCFFISYRIWLLADLDYRQSLRAYIESQHNEPLIASLYKTLFLADFLPHTWRDLSNKLGIAHLIAISGFHLGILSLVLGGLLGFVYGRFHRFISYRNKYFDIGILLCAVLFLYLLVLDFTPSFLRAYVMSVCGFVAIFSGINLLSFRLLFVVVALCLALFPRLIFSVGFGLSVSGVFFIYLFAKFSKIQKWRGVMGKFVLLPLWFNTLIFLDMLVLVHWFFPYFTPLNMLSIFLSLLFVVFFPCMLMAHILGFGWLCDGVLQWAMKLELDSIEFFTPTWLLCIFLLLCVLAMRFRIAYIALHCVGLGFFSFLCMRFMNLAYGL
ncbi:ComEC/Rec2 family competence protein [Helicobacter cinaedi]|uniref:ComEC/Rec2 family competence protein n=1 Tax=Helicobacter cinaedi TaxID=213 RepID=UPI00215D80AA|nr:ComEC/Rec2 family competence protein [Helicobacter cinaedi]